MRRCPGCKQAVANATFSGWVLKVQGSVVFNDEGDVDQISPLTPMVTIKKGKELDGYLTEVVCPKCGFTGKSVLFTRITSCWFTGKAPAPLQITIPGVGIKFYSPEYVGAELLEMYVNGASTLPPFLSSMQDISKALS